MHLWLGGRATTRCCSCGLAKHAHAADCFGMAQRAFYVHCGNKLRVALAPSFSIGGVPWKDDEFEPELSVEVSVRGVRVEGRRSGE